MTFPMPHCGQMLPARMIRLRGFGWGAAAASVPLSGAEGWADGAAGAASEVAMPTRRAELSLNTCITISCTICFSSSMNCGALYCCCSMRRNLRSQRPVSSALFSSSSLMMAISLMPVGVARIFFRCRRMYCRRNSVVHQPQQYDHPQMLPLH